MPIGLLAMLESMYCLNPVIGDGSTLMHFAAGARKRSIVKWLLTNGYGAMTTQKDDRGHMPLHCALRSGDVTTCRLLLSQPDEYRPAAIYGSDIEGGGGWVDELREILTPPDLACAT